MHATSGHQPSGSFLRRDHSQTHLWHKKCSQITPNSHTKRELNVSLVTWNMAFCTGLVLCVRQDQHWPVARGERPGYDCWNRCGALARCADNSHGAGALCCGLCVGSPVMSRQRRSVRVALDKLAADQRPPEGLPDLLHTLLLCVKVGHRLCQWPDVLHIPCTTRATGSSRVAAFGARLWCSATQRPLPL